MQQSPAKSKHRKSLDFLRRIEPYQGVTTTPRALFVVRRFPLRRRPRGGVGAACSPVVCRCPGLHRAPVAFSSEVKGWRLFLIADAWASVVRLGDRRPMSAKKEPHESTDPRVMAGTGTLRKKTGRSIRCPARNSPAKGPNRFRAQWTSGRAPALHAASVSQPCLLMLPFRFAHARRMWPLSVAR